MQAKASFSPSRAFGVIFGSALVVAGLALIGLYAVLWWADYNRVPVDLPSPPPIALGDRVLLPSLAELLAPAEVDTTPEADEPEPDPVVIGPTSIGQVERIVIPRIGVDSAVISVGISRGEWPVPKFIVGHLKESVQPGEVGNSVFAGHLTSLTLGNVFEHLKDLKVGDEVTFYGKEGVIQYQVTETKAVKNTDTSVLGNKPGQALVTLITCEGRWVPAQNDYDQSRVVFAEPIV